MSNWSDVTDEAFNRMVNNFRKTEDFDESFDIFTETLEGKMEEDGIDVYWGWAGDLSTNDVSEIIKVSVDRMSSYVDEGFMGAFNTYLNDKVFEVEETHGAENVEKWQEIINS